MSRDHEWAVREILRVFGSGYDPEAPSHLAHMLDAIAVLDAMPTTRRPSCASLRAEVADLRAHAEAMAAEKATVCWDVDLYECPCDEPGDCPVAAYRAFHPLPPESP